MTNTEIRRAEAQLRRYDRALRLRRSMEQPDRLLLERKVFRGRLGALGPQGLEWPPDIGYRWEWGHVPVASVGTDTFDLRALLEALRAADSWRLWDRHAEPLWRRVEAADERARAQRARAKWEGLRYKASELFDRYAWLTKSRVSVPVQVEGG